MIDKELYKIAKAYVDKQLRTMKENGLEVAKISEHEYEVMVKKIAQAIGNSAGRKRAAASST